MDWKALATVDEFAPTVEAECVAAVNGMPRPTPWQIVNLSQADWAMRQVGEARARLAEYDDVIAQWQEARQRIFRAGEWYEQRLTEWAVSQRTKQTKSFPTAHGTVSTRESGDAVEIVDAVALLAWAKANAPTLINTVESVPVSNVKPVVTIEHWAIGADLIDVATGEVLRAVDFGVPVRPDGDEWAAFVEGVDEATVGVRRVLVAVVVDGDKRPVPGLGVRPGKVTATVSPILT